MFLLPTFKISFWNFQEFNHYTVPQAVGLQLAAFGTGLLVGYPLWRGWTLYTSQVEHLRTSLCPVEIRSSDLKYKGAVHAVWKLWKTERSLKTLYRGMGPLLLMVPITTSATIYLATMADKEIPNNIKSTPQNVVLAAGALVLADIVCQPLRYLHIRMASCPAGEKSKPTSMQIVSRAKSSGLRTGLGFGLLATLFSTLPLHLSITNPAPGPDDVGAFLDLSTLIGVTCCSILATTFHAASVRRIVDSGRTFQTDQDLVPRYPKALASTFLPWILQVRGSWRVKCIGMLSLILPSMCLEIPSLILDCVSTYNTLLPEHEKISERFKALEDEEKRNEAEKLLARE